MTKPRSVVAAFSLVLGLLACVGSASQAGQPSDVAALHAADDAWLKAYSSGQLEGVVALYDENAVVYPPGAAPQHGRAAIHDFFATDMAEFAKTGLVMELGDKPTGGASGNTGWSSGTWTVKDKAGQVIDSGWYFSVSRKVGGKWLYVRDAWNSAKPVTAPSPEEK